MRHINPTTLCAWARAISRYQRWLTGWLAAVSAAAGGGPPRRETRARKVSQRMAIVDESTRQQVNLRE